MSIIKVTFNYTGANQTFIIPPFVERILVKEWGAGGGNGQGVSNGGPGGYSMGTLPVTSGQTLNIMVGQGGNGRSTTPSFGGGGPGGNDSSASNFDGACGGGRSGVAIGAGLQLLIAGGGGGAAGATAQNVWSNGGAGGGLLGINGFIGPTGNANAPGRGGTQIAGGAGGIYTTPPNGNGLPGSSLQGGQGGPTNIVNAAAGGGGGGGFFGGGGGAGQFTNTANPLEQDAAGGGGSAHIDPIVINGTTLNTAQNTNLSAGGPLTLPPNTSDPDYIAGIGAGGISGINNGGNGLVVIIYDQPTLVMNKTVSSNFSDINSNLTYTITVNNTGSVTITNTIFIDTVPSNTTFVSNSLTLDGSPVPGTPNPPGITIPSIAPGATSTVQFMVSIGSTVPNPNRITNVASTSYSGGFTFNSNIVTTTINNATLQSTKSNSQVFADVGDIITYTITIANIGSVTASNILFIDTISNGSSLVPNSLNQDGTLIPGNPNPPGVILPNGVGPGTVSTVTMQVTVTTIPSPNPIPNSATLNFSYVINPATTPNITGNRSTSTNITNTTINNANLNNIVKSVDKAFASCGNILTYTITIPNVGNVTAMNVVFHDTVPNGTSLVANSVTINGNIVPGANPSTGITIPNINSGGLSTITFKVIVNC